MKSSKKAFILLEAALAVMVFMTVTGMFLEKSREERGKVSVIVLNSESSRWSAFKYGLRMAAEDRNVEMLVVSTGENMSAKEEYEAVLQEIENGADAVIVQPVPEESTESLFQKADNKIPMIFIEDPMAADIIGSAPPTVQPDNYVLGQALGEELLKDYGGNLSSKKLGVLAEYGNSEAALKRKEGLLSVLKGKGVQVRWDLSDFSREEEETILRDQSKVDLVLALDDSSLVLAGKTALANNLHGALVYGIGNSMDAVYCLDTGYVQCLLVPDDFNMGYQSLCEAAKVLGHTLKKPESQTVSYTMMRRDTLFSKENQEILFTMSQ
ncbi:MAG: sugar ABC transporter substrate-binding protein [Eubacterium sp.]|jgi:ribose transport system substrate-binding protein|nr:sugar ABC transporter substrate-binding protein [Eubacterium sp.]